MVAKSSSIPLFNIFVKTAIGIIVLGYAFVTFMLGVLGITEAICIAGLCFRFSFVINESTPQWKIIVGLFAYAIAFMLNSSSIILGLALGGVFFLDCLQYAKARPINQTK